MLVAGQQGEVVADAVSKVDGVNKVLLYKEDGFEQRVAENMTSLVAGLQEQKKYSHILFSATNEGKNVMPRTSAKVDGAAISDVLSVQSEDEFVRPTYAGNAIATVSTTHSPKVMTIRGTAFEKAGVGAAGAEIEAVSVTAPIFDKTQFIQDTVEKSDRPEISAADIVIAGGRALKSAENFEVLYKFADAFKQGAAVGASRAAVDAGYAPNDLQIGQTGKVCAPDLYFAVGISGAIQHLAGMKDSKCIVAINTDEEAPIFQVSDYGLKADLFTAIPELTEKLK